MARTEPEWLSLDIALAVHDRQLAEHLRLARVRQWKAVDVR